MTEPDPGLERLRHEHTPANVRRRLSAPPRASHLRDVIYGAIDGAVTTFAIVAGVAGAGLEAGVILILGAANLVADGFSMAASNFLGTRAAREQRTLALAEEAHHIQLVPEGEREEVRQIYAAKGFEGAELEHIVEVLTADHELWAETMVSEELGLGWVETSEHRAALATFLAFLTVGSLPLLPFAADELLGAGVPAPFAISAALTGAGFAIVGLAKARVVGRRAIAGMIETVGVGGIAAAIAFAIGSALGGLS